MKTPLMILAALALSATASAQKVSEADVPKPVKSAFMKQFPKAEHAKWEMETKTEYEVNFKIGSDEMSATYGTAGQWMETEKELKMADLPAAVRKTIAEKYADQKTGDISHVDSPKGETYEVDMKKGEKSMEVVFSKDGKMLKENVEEKGKEEND